MSNQVPSVLVIAYFFPPMGGAGVQRTLKFVKYLPEFGWQPHVLTAHPPKSGPRDSGLLNEIKPDIPIVRTAAFLLPRQLPWRFRNFVSRWFLIVDEQLGWLPFAVSAGRKILRASGDIKIIYSSSSPYTSHLIARQLHNRTHVPWIADFRDPWLANPFIKFPTSFHRRVNELLERNVFFQADRVILNTETTRRHYLQKYPNLPPSKMAVITNGYDQADLPERSDRIELNSRFTIIHMGSLYPGSRSSRYFLNALRVILQTDQIMQNKVKVQFIGNIDKETRRLVRELNLGGNVDLLGHLPHLQALNHLLTADLLLLIPSYGVGSEMFLPAKLYEYLASKRPILCLAESGECTDLVNQTRAGSSVPPTDIRKIAEELVRLYRQWQKGQLIIHPDQELIQNLNRRRLTEQLASIFNDLTRPAA